MKGKLAISVVLVVVLAMVLGAGVVNAELVGYWKFDETSGSTAGDSAGANDGTNNGATINQPGKTGLAYSFDGDDYVEIPRVVQDDFTIAFWVKTTQTGGMGQWWSCVGFVDGEMDGQTDDFGTVLNGGKFGFGVGNFDWTIVSTSNINDGEWHHVAATRVSSSGLMKIYVDGVEENSGMGGTGPRTAPSRLTIGMIQTSGNYFVGLIDDLAIFDHALSTEEVMLLYRQDLLPALQILTGAVQETEAITKEQGPQEAIAFLEKRIAESEQMREKNPKEASGTALVLPDLYFQLAKAKEAADFPKKDVAAAYKRAIFSFKEKGVALTWLFKNLLAGEYKNIIKTAVQDSPHITHTYEGITRRLESSGKWLAFKLLLDVLFSEIKDPVAAAKLVEPGLLREGAWWKKYLEYCRGKLQLAEYVFGRDCEIAEEYIAKENFKRAAEIYRDIIALDGSAQYKSALELKVYECLFNGGEYQSAVSELDRFIARNKATNRSLTKEAILMKGRCYVQLGKLGKASDEFLTLMIEYPETKQAPEAAFFIGYFYMLQGKFEEAKGAFDVVVQEYPKSSYASKARICMTRIKGLAGE